MPNAAVEGAVGAVRLVSDFYGAGYQGAPLPDRPTGTDDATWNELARLYGLGRDDAKAGRAPRYELYRDTKQPDAGLLSISDANTKTAPEGWKFDWGSAAIGGAGVLLLERLRRPPPPPPYYYPPPRRPPPPRYYPPSRRYY